MSNLAERSQWIIQTLQNRSDYNKTHTLLDTVNVLRALNAEIERLQESLEVAELEIDTLEKEKLKNKHGITYWIGWILFNFLSGFFWGLFFMITGLWK